MRGFTETVTVWHRTQVDGKDVWTRTIVPNCTWESDTVRAVYSNTANIASTMYSLMPQGTVVSMGDIVAKGAHDVDITGVTPYREAEVRQSMMPQVFTVRTVKDLTAIYKLGKHIEVEGI